MTFEEWWEEQQKHYTSGRPWPVSKRLCAEHAFKAGLEQALEILNVAQNYGTLTIADCLGKIRDELEQMK